MRLCWSLSTPLTCFACPRTRSWRHSFMSSKRRWRLWRRAGGNKSLHPVLILLPQQRPSPPPLPRGPLGYPLRVLSLLRRHPHHPHNRRRRQGGLSLTRGRWVNLLRRLSRISRSIRLLCLRRRSSSHRSSRQGSQQCRMVEATTLEGEVVKLIGRRTPQPRASGSARTPSMSGASWSTCG